MDNCTWIPKNQTDIVVSDYGEWTPSAAELDRFLDELAGYMGLPVATVAAQIDDQFVVVQHQTTGRLLVVFPTQNTVLEQFCPVGAGGKKWIWLAGLGIVGGGIGYLVTRDSRRPLIGVGAGAAAGVLGAFLLTQALPKTLTAGLPRQARVAPRGAMGGYPQRVLLNPRGAVGSYPQRVIPASRGAMGAPTVRRYDESGMRVESNFHRGCIAC